MTATPVQDETRAAPNRPADRRRIGTIVLLAALAITLVTQLALYGKVLQDDAFISFVYARNLVRGHGLVFNAGEAPVEGYTNYLWTILTAAGMVTGLNPIHVVLTLGIASSLGILVVTARIARDLGASPALAAGSAALLATKLPFATEGIGGLETPLFALLVLAALLPRLKATSTPRAGLLSSCLLGLAALTRPEGILVFVLVEGFELVGTLVDGRGRGVAPYLRRAAVRSLPFVLIVGAHLLWRVLTYGDIVPNTFHAKVDPGWEQWVRGFDYVARGVNYFDYFLFFLPFVVFLVRRGERAWRLCLFLSATYTAYVIYVGGDFKPTFRFLIVLLPLWSAMAVAALHAVGEHLRLGRSGAGRTGAVIVLIVLGAISAVRLWEFSRPWLERGKDVKEPAVGVHLRKRLPPDAWIAVSQAGAIPYYSDRRTIDMFGLSDAHIARAPVRPNALKAAGHQKGDGAYVLSRRPDVILFMNLDYTRNPLTAHPQWRQVVQQYAFGTSEMEIASSPLFFEGYEPVSDRLPDGGYVNYFRRKSDPAR